MLARRDYSRAELSHALLERGTTMDLAAEICKDFEAQGLLDDQRVALELLSKALGKVDIGSARLAMLLRKRKLSPSLVEDAVKRYQTQADEVVRAQLLAERFFAKGLSRSAIERRLWQRGMPASAVKAAIDRLNLDNGTNEG